MIDLVEVFQGNVLIACALMTLKNSLKGKKPKIANQHQYEM